MKIRVVSSNQILATAIKDNVTGIDIDIVADSAGLVNVDHDIIVVDDAAVKVEAMTEAMPSLKSKVIYLASGQAGKNVKITGATVIVFDGRTVSIIDEVKREIKGLAIYKNVLTFWSPISGAGTTMVGMTILHNVPSSYRTLYLSLTDVPGVEYIGGVEGSVTDILPRLISGVLDVQELVSACKVIDNHYILSGLNSYIDVPPYSIENIKSLISMASAYFDYVIIDAGYSASLMAIAAMSVSEHVFVITTNSANAAIRYELQYRQVYGNVPEIRKERFKLITNMEDKDMLGSGRTVKAYGLQSIATVRKVENAVGIRAEYEGELIYNLDAAPGYRRDMDALTGAIFTEIGAIQANTKKTERRGLFGRRAAE